MVELLIKNKKKNESEEMKMVLNESELQQVYESAKKASFSQLVLLSSMFQSFTENVAKESQEEFNFMINNYELQNKSILGVKK